MDSTSQDILIRIFSFLTGNDVGRFIQLNRRISEIIKNNRINLDFPKLLFKWFNYDYLKEESGNRNKDVLIVVNRLFSFYSDDSPGNPKVSKANSFFPASFLKRFLKIEEFEHNSEKDAIFKCLCNYNDIHFLESLVKNTFEKADVELEFQYYTRINYRILTEAVKTTKNFVRSLRIAADDPNYKEWLELVSAVGSQKLKSKVYPKLCLILEKNRSSRWSNLKKLNELTSMYRSAYFVMHSNKSAKNMAALAMEWRSLNFPELFFNIELCSPFSRFDCFHGLEEYIGSIFNVSYMFPMESPKSSETSSVRLEDVATGNILQLEKMEEKIGSRANWDRYDCFTCLIQITVIRKIGNKELLK